MADGSLLRNLTFTVLGGFTAAEFNLESGDPRSFEVTLTSGPNGETFKQTLTASQGSNIFNIVAPTGTVFTTATFTSTDGGFTDFKQLRLTTASMTAVPEPGTWAMMLLGFGGLGVAMRRRRRDTSRLLQVA
jgi:hypothetical protein